MRENGAVPNVPLRVAGLVVTTSSGVSDSRNGYTLHHMTRPSHAVPGDSVNMNEVIMKYRDTMYS